MRPGDGVLDTENKEVSCVTVAQIKYEPAAGST